MKKLASLESNRIRPPRPRGGGRKSAATAGLAKSVKLVPARRTEPAGLLKEHFSGDHEARTVSFEYFNPAAREILVAGSFNGWQPCATPMVKQRGGKWSAGVLLKPGAYEYRFVVDGQWQTDPMAARFVANPFGGLNSVINVSPDSTPLARQS